VDESIVVSVVVINFRQQSDKLKLAPSVRNYDRVIPPSHVSSSSEPQQQQSGVAKIRPGHRGSRLPSSQEVFDLGIHPPPASSDVDVSPSPNGPPEPSPIGVLNPPTSASISSSTPKTVDSTGRAPGKRSTKKDDKSNPSRCLRGIPPELQKSYFVPDDERNSAKNDPFWELPEAHPSPRRPSIEQQSSSFFKPPSSSEDLAPNSEVVADVNTSVL